MMNQNVCASELSGQFSEVGTAELQTVEGGNLALLLSWAGNKLRDALMTKYCAESAGGCYDGIVIEAIT